VGQLRHPFFLSPFVGSRVVLVVETRSLTFIPAADHVHFAVEGNTIKFFIRIREWCGLFPRVYWHLSQRGGAENQVGNQGKHCGSTL